MRVTVLVHAADLGELGRYIFEPNRGLELTARVFPVQDHTFDLAVVHNDGRGNYHFERDSRVEAEEVVVERSCTIIFLAGSNAVSSPEIRRILTQFLSGQRPKTPEANARNEAVIVLDYTGRANQYLSHLPQSKVFHLVDGANMHESTNGKELAAIDQEILGTLQSIEENQTYNPNVGFGLLLLDKSHNFFLMKRLREPGKGQLGTIGGKFTRGLDIEQQLDEVLRKRYRSSTTPNIELGPLLACTNMRNDFFHYIDLTFLAMARGHNILDGIMDEDLRYVDVDTLKSIDTSGTVTYPRTMFSLSEMAAFYNRGLLFKPVANAFEAFYRRMVEYEASRGRNRSVRFPSLLNDSRMLEIIWHNQPPPTQITDMIGDWARTALPFFEGGVV